MHPLHRLHQTVLCTMWTRSDLSFHTVITVRPAVVSGEECHVSSIEETTRRYFPFMSGYTHKQWAQRPLKDICLPIVSSNPTIGWMSPNIMKGTVISTQVTPAIIHFRTLSQDLLRQDCPNFNSSYSSPMPSDSCHSKRPFSIRAKLVRTKFKFKVMWSYSLPVSVMIGWSNPWGSPTYLPWPETMQFWLPPSWRICLGREWLLIPTKNARYIECSFYRLNCQYFHLFPDPIREWWSNGYLTMTSSMTA